MVIPPKISANMQKKHKGDTVISLQNGKIVAFGKDPRIALKNAKKVIPDIDNIEFVVSRIHHTYLAM